MGTRCACENCGTPGPRHDDACPKPGVRYCIPCGAQIEGEGSWPHSDDCPKAASTELAQGIFKRADRARTRAAGRRALKS